MAFEIRPYPEWSWSLSRDNILGECPRKYYYQYYGGHNGWLKDAPLEFQKTYRLKHLKNLYLVLGESLHSIIKEVINNFLANNNLPEEQALILRIKGILNKAYSDSKNKEKWWNNVKYFNMLHEIYYEGRLPNKRVEEIKLRIPSCVSNFLACQSFERIKSKDLELIEIDSSEPPHFFLDDLKIYVNPDLMYKSSENLTIVDWKTGHENDKDKEQLILYALYATDKYKVPVDSIVCRIENLLSGKSDSFDVQVTDTITMKDKILQSQRIMQQYLKKAEVNEPVNVNGFGATPAKIVCGFCNYREICFEKE